MKNHPEAARYFALIDFHSGSCIMIYLYRVGWVEFLQIPLKLSVSRALYFLNSEWCILLKCVAYKTATKQLIFYLKNEYFDISQLLSKLSKYSFGSTLIIFGLGLLRLSFFKIRPARASKRPILAQFS